MGPPKPIRGISQQAFDEMVNENISDLGMDPTEALQDAIDTLTLQGVDLSGIVTCVPGESNPVIESLERIKQLSSSSSNWTNDAELDEVVGLLDKLTDFSSVEGSGNAAIATKNGGVELVCSICSKLGKESDRALISALNSLASFLHDLQSTDTFHKSGGPKILVGILNDRSQNVNVLNSGFSVVAAAATANEVLKESFMDLQLDQLMIRILREHSNWSVNSLYDAIRVLLTSDDCRVMASQVFGYARKFAKLGMAEALVNSLREGIASPSLVSVTIALKAVAVNDEICRSVAEYGGVDALLCCIDNCGEQGNNVVARACGALLSKLAGGDTNKSTIVEKEGLSRFIKLSGRFSDDPSVLQEVMSIFCTLSLRSPDNAARAVEAGAGDLALQAMQKFPQSQLLQKNACLMIRNLVARNPENRTLLLSNGFERIIRKAKDRHESCKDAATAALRDLGLDNYNS